VYFCRGEGSRAFAFEGWGQVGWAGEDGLAVMRDERGSANMTRERHGLVRPMPRQEATLFIQLFR